MPPNVRILLKEKIGHGSFDGKLPCFYQTGCTCIGKGALIAANESSGTSFPRLG